MSIATDGVMRDYGHGSRDIQDRIILALRRTQDLLGVTDVPLTPGMAITADLQADISKKMELAGADPCLLATVGSLGDTIEAQEVLRMLREWNDREEIVRQAQPKRKR